MSSPSPSIAQRGSSLVPVVVGPSVVVVEVAGSSVVAPLVLGSVVPESSTTVASVVSPSLPLGVVVLVLPAAWVVPESSPGQPVSARPAAISRPSMVVGRRGRGWWQSGWSKGRSPLGVGPRPHATEPRAEVRAATGAAEDPWSANDRGVTRSHEKKSRRPPRGEGYPDRDQSLWCSAVPSSSVPTQSRSLAPSTSVEP